MNKPATLQESVFLRTHTLLTWATVFSVLVAVTGSSILFYLNFSPAFWALPLILAAIVIWAWVSHSRALRAMDETRQVISSLLIQFEGQSAPAETDALLAARLGEKLSARADMLATEVDGFKLILSSMGDGILVLDSRRNVLFSNPAARKILGIPDEDPLAQSLIQLTQQAELLANIEMSIVGMQASSFEFSLPIAGATPPQRRFIQARCAPFINEKQALAGAVAVLHDITDLRRLERMRTEFVSNVSHELRTPLTSLMGYLETLEDGGLDDREQSREFLKICSRQAENLSRIVEDLLRLSKLENPQSEIAETAVSLNEVARAAVEQCEPIARKRGIKLTQETPADEVVIKGDRGLLVQALSNLIENAINYNREHGSVIVRLTMAHHKPNGIDHHDSTSEPPEWDVAVIDTGIGIPSHALQRVFERFYRVDKARSRSQGGTGLGLAIVKHIALAHGASVHVESEVGKGTTFFHSLQVRQTSEGAELSAHVGG